MNKLVLSILSFIIIILSRKLHRIINRPGHYRVISQLFPNVRSDHTFSSDQSGVHKDTNHPLDRGIGKSRCRRYLGPCTALISYRIEHSFLRIRQTLDFRKGLLTVFVEECHIQSVLAHIEHESKDTAVHASVTTPMPSLTSLCIQLRGTLRP